MFDFIICSDDCGIYVLKYLDIWDGNIKCDGKTMPDYSLVRCFGLSQCHAIHQIYNVI